MTSRLDRLFILLDQGTTSLTRKAAATQLGEIQKAHPNEFDVLLNRLKKYLYSNSWDTRIAANQAIEAIIKNINWEINFIKEEINYEYHPSIKQLENERFSFENFSLENIFIHGKNIFIEKESNLQEKIQDDELNKSLIEILKFSKANQINLNKPLNEIFQIKKNENDIKNEILEEQNKRKFEFSENDLISSKKIKLENVENEDKIDLSKTNEFSWPLLQFANELKVDLFNPKWEIRHGSAIALRDLIKFHGKLAGRISQFSCVEMDNLNKIWLVDLALRLITVLALDKFGDYLSDQVVAPVRETCAQALSSIFNILEIDLVKLFLDILIQLLKHKEWQTRHGGLLSLKYLLAVRQDFASDLLPIVFEPIFLCLKDGEDDVSSVAASALVPVKDKLIEILPDKIPLVIDYLWNSLLVIDELTSSTSNILLLLSSLLAQQVDRDNEQLNNLIPRLWPFLDHTMSIVRKSILDAFIILISENNSWLTVNLLSDSLRLIFQQILIEDCVEIQSKLYTAWFYLVSKSPLDNLLNATYLHLSGWLCLLMHPSKLAITSQSCPVWLNIKNEQNIESKRIYIGGTDLLSSSIKEETKINARLRASKFLSLLLFYLVKCKTTTPPSSLESICNLLELHLCSKSAIQRMCVSWLIQNWAIIAKENNTQFEISVKLIEKFFLSLQEFIFYDEIAVSFTNVQHETRSFINVLIANKLELNETVYKKSSVFTFQQIHELLNDVYPNLFKNFQTKTKQKIKENLDEKRKNLSRSLETLNKSQNILINHVTSALSCALIACKYFPDKLNPIIRPIMESLKKEENENLQMISAVHLAKLIELCNEKNEQPISKIIKNLVSFVCADHNFTPEISEDITEKNEACTSKTEKKNSTQNYYSNDIIALLNTQKIYEAKIAKKNTTSNINKLVPEEVLENTLNEASVKSFELVRRGASFAIIEFFKYFKNDVIDKVKPLWQSIMSISDLISSEEISLEIAQKLLQSLQVLEIILPHCTEELKDNLKCLLNCLIKCLECKYSQIRHLASRCIAAFAFISLKETMNLVLLSLLNLLEFSENSIKRQGAIETFYYLIEKLGIKIVPYIVLIVVPMMGRMSDQVESVRTLATQCFAQLVRLMPLDNSKENDKLLDQKFLEKKRQQSEFLEQLLCPKNLTEYKLPIPIKVDLRSYQQDGVNWLAFLNKYRLHGILCDEMGLGKTLMSICMIAADHYYRSEEKKTELPSLVICPSTLTGHWYFEAKKFVDESFLNVVDYSKIRFMSKAKNSLKPDEKKKLEYNLVVASYDIVRNDISYFSSISWNYCILDEGHIIKNGKTKLSKAIKSLNANHRLILTGTPIQNNVLELWSLFDFLMPGYLGTERQFNVKYSKPILASRDGKASSKEQETSVFAMESLHAQVLPFILRRMKDDVLQDLPPKIIQDYYCELSPLQSKLYEDFSKSNAKQTIEKTFDKTKTDSTKQIENPAKSHIFQALQYLRKVCNHPKLVLDSNHPHYESTIKSLKEQGSSLSSINNATKLCALKQLLLDCGIGLQTNENTLNEPIVNQHRALIFFQMKSMLEIVQNDLLIKEMPSVTYLRLDGSIPAASRHQVVDKFNNDLSIDVLLLTTHVGGLGLNLTGADTVIFVEHDWNPMKDLQAMDRAHRIGQKKVVNVYRLITNGTLEEKIMGLQRFKLQIANTVISQENSSLQTMGTEQLLDLFQFEHKQQKTDDESSVIKCKENIPTSYKTLLDELPDIWDENQYDTEYDLTEFINSFKK